MATVDIFLSKWINASEEKREFPRKYTLKALMSEQSMC
jgi:hypothetical protein